MRAGRAVPAWLSGLSGLAGAALVAAAVSFAGIGSHSLWTPDEPRDAAIGKAMWASGDLVVPRLNGRPFLEKPPLAWWAQAAAFRVLGVSDAAARVPSALFATLTLLIVFALGRRLGGPRAGWLAAGALASTVEFAEDMGRAIVDPALVLMVALAHAGFAVLVTSRAWTVTAGDVPPAVRRERRGAYLLISLAVPLAFLAKGIVGIGLALGPPVLYLLAAAFRNAASGASADAAVPAGRGSDGEGGEAHGSAPDGRVPGEAAAREKLPGEDTGSAATETRRLRETVRLLAPLALLGVPLFAAIVLPWVLALLREGGWAALRECLVGNTVGRLLATEAGRAYGHRQPFWYYLPAGAAALLPWTLALPAMLRGGGARPPRKSQTVSLEQVPGERAGAARRGGPPGEPLPAMASAPAVPFASVAPTLASASDAPLASAQPAVASAPAVPRLVPAVPLLTAERGRGLLIAAFFIGVLLLSLAASKRSLYLVPLLPAIAVPIGLWLDGLGSGGGPRPRWDRPTALLLLGLAALLPAAIWTAAWAAARGVFHAFPAAPLRAELTGGRLAGGGAAAAVATALLLLVLVRHLRAGTTPIGPWLVLPFLAIGLVYQTAVKAAIDPLKNPHDLTAAIARLDPGTGPVAAYRPSETALGIVELDLGRRVEAIAGPAELAALLGARPEGMLFLSLQDWRRLPAPLRARLRIVYDETPTKASPYAIAAWTRERSQ